MLQEFVQQVKDTVKAELTGIHTAIPGIIEEFDAAKCLATVTPKMMFKKPGGEKMEYPKIFGVPVLIPQSASGGAVIAFPIKPGDSCLLIVSEQSLDYWMYEQETNTDLRFDLSNAVCIPGLLQKPVSAVATACASNAVVVTAPSIIINGNVTINGSLTTQGGTVNLN